MAITTMGAPNGGARRISPGMWSYGGKTVRSTVDPSKVKPVVKPKGTTPAPTTPAVTPPVTTPPPAPETPAPEPDPFKSIYDFALKNFQDSPLYNFQKQELDTTLNRRLAKQGLLGSGAELEAAQKAQQSLGAEWTDRILNMAGQDANRYDAQQSQAAEANQATNSDRRATGLRLLELMLGQNPMNEAVGGLADFSKIAQQIADINAGYARDNYNVVNPRFTSAGGGGGPAPTRQVVDQGPNLTGVNLARATANASSGSNWTNLIQNIMGSLF